MELRWILIIISLIILALIVIDGWRRLKRQQKQNRKIIVPGKEAFKANTQLKNQKQPAWADEELPASDQDEIITPRKPMTGSSMDSFVDGLPEGEASDEEKLNIPDTLFVINVMAMPGNMISGSQLLPSLLALGLRHGEMSIFHRHEQSSGLGAVLFSLTSALEPGVFNLTTMESQYFTGVTLFLRIPGPKNPTNALKLMLQTAKRLAQMLDGELRDETHRLLDPSDIEQHYYVRLRQTLGTT